MKSPSMISAIFGVLLVAAVECPPFSDSIQLAGSRDQAETACKKQEGRSLPPGHWVQDVQPAMLPQKVMTLWLSPRRHDLDEPEWIDGHVIEPGENFAGPCGFYVPRDDVVEMTFCNERPFGFICNLKVQHDCATCDNGHPSAQCFLHGDNCYALYDKSQNWYEARAHCQRQGGDLVVLSSKRLKEKIRAQVKSGERTNFWVGLRKEKWSLEDSETTALSTHWLPGEPSPKLPCMVAARADDGKKFGWKTANCSQLHRSVCVEGHPPNDTNDVQQNDTGKDFENGNLTRLLMAAVQRQDQKLDDFKLMMTQQMKHGFESVWLMEITSLSINIIVIAAVLAFIKRKHIIKIYRWVCKKLRSLQSRSTASPDVKSNAEEIELTAVDTEEDQAAGTSAVQTDNGSNLQQEAGDTMFPVNRHN